jgi:hypothetical protein
MRRLRVTKERLYLEERKRRAWRTMQKRTAEKYSEKER